MYGRTSQRICNPDFTHRFFEKTCANIDQSKSQTKLRCQGKSTCQMLIDSEVFTDPCGSTIPKHFEVHYRCLDSKQLCARLIDQCVKSNDLKCLEKIHDDFSCQCPPNICQYTNNQITGFVKYFCPEEYLQGFHWPKTAIQQGQSLSCPSPCTGEAFRFCHSTNQWSRANYTNCHCPLKQSDQLSTYRSATSYAFQCNFWLINRIMPEADLCTLSFTNRNDDGDALNCLLSGFERMTFQSCAQTQSFGIDFQNIAFEIHIPKSNESRFQFFAHTHDLPVRVIVDRTQMITDTSNLSMMAINPKISNSPNQSILLIEQESDFFSLQTANITVVFEHQSSAFHYRCRGYHSKSVESTNRFFACQLLCSNASHVICQCPFFNPFMHYVLDSDRLKTDEENDFLDDEQCTGKKIDSFDRISRYLDGSLSINSAKSLLIFIDRLISKAEVMTNSTIVYEMIHQIKRVAFQIIPLTNSFTSTNNHLELAIQPNQLNIENHNRSVIISITPTENPRSDYQLIFFTISNLTFNGTFNSDLVHVNLVPNNLSINSIQIIFRHIRNQRSICVDLKTHNVEQWSTNGCRLLSTNFTHSICSCDHLSTFALLMDFPKPTVHSLSHVPKIGCIISIICLFLTIVALIIKRYHKDIDDDLTIVRNILHTNMLLCLIIVQILFLFGLEQIKYKFVCRMISILLDYFLLASFSWMFVDGMELLIALKHGFQIDRIRLIAYSLYSYGFPLMIVFLSMTLSAKNENSSSQYCWLSHDNACMWTFAIPFILLIMANLCFFAVAIYSICKRSEQKDRIRCSLRDISTISILYGLTWIIALFYLYDQSTLFAYVFAILNSIHACLIFIFYCVRPKHIRHLKLPFFHRTNENDDHPNRKSLEHYSVPDNTSSSGYSSGHSSDVNNKQIRCPSKQDYIVNHYDRRSSLNPETPYLPSIPINLLTNRLSTFRYPLPSSDQMILSYEQKEQLLRKSATHEDDHQYYEIG